VNSYIPYNKKNSVPSRPGNYALPVKITYNDMEENKQVIEKK